MSGVNTVARALGSPHMLAWLSTVEPLRGFLGSLTVFSVLHVLLARLMLRWEWRAAPGYGTSARKPAFGWQLACRVVAMVHAVCVTSLGAACFRGAGRLSTIEWTAAHGAAETAVSAFSAGFFLQDWAYIVVKEWDITFFLHHTAVLCFLAASHISGAAGRVCAVGLSMGEATNVLQNTLWITRALSNPERPRQFALAVALKKKLVRGWVTRARAYGHCICCCCIYLSICCICCCICCCIWLI
jgi:hypothetical protein